MIEDFYKTRLEICKQCVNWDPFAFENTGKCNLCGCSTLYKLKTPSERCPIDLWGPVKQDALSIESKKEYTLNLIDKINIPLVDYINQENEEQKKILEGNSKKKFIWTFWTFPYKYKINIKDIVFLALSIELVKKFCPNVHVYTDIRGIRELELYGIQANLIETNFNISHEIVNKDFCSKSRRPEISEILNSNRIFLKKSCCKLITMSLQDEEFCHLDNDVFLLKPQRLIKNTEDIVVQSTESYGIDTWHNIRAYDLALDLGVDIPDEIKQARINNDFSGYNCGYIDVKNVELCKKWAETGIKMFEKFLPFTNELNRFPEQFLLHCLSKYSNYRVGTLLNEQWINHEAEKIGYVHLISAKDEMNFDDEIFIKILRRLKITNSEIYNNIINKHKYLELK